SCSPMRLLLDAHLSPELAAALRRPGHDCVGIRDWHEGALLDAPDEAILEAAADDQRILVTGDYDSMDELLRIWAAHERQHAGVIFIRHDDRRRTRIGSVMRRLDALLARLADVDWSNRAVYLPPD